MALIWARGDLSGVRNSVNTDFSIPNYPANAIVWIYLEGILQGQTNIDPDVDECVVVGPLVSLGLAPLASSHLWYVIASEEGAPGTSLDAIVAGSAAAAAAVYLNDLRETFYFNVHLRDVAGNLKEILESEVSEISWSYAPTGGCMEARIVIRRPFDQYGEIARDWEVEIWRELDQLGQAGARLPAQFTTAGIQLGTSHVGTRQLRWSGYVFEKQPVLRPDSSGDIGEYLELRCLGHGMRLRRVFIPGFQPQVGDDVGAVVRSMMESHVLGATKIKRSVGLGLVQDTGIPIGVMDPILTYASNALEMFALIGGGIEHGVRADKEFYFTVRQHIVKATYPIGGRIEAYMPLESSDDEVHRIWIQGGNGTVYPVDVVPFQVGNQKDLFVSVAGVNSQASAQLWATGYASAHAPGSTTPAGRLRLVGGADWIESVGQPIGLLRVIGGPVFVAAGDRLDALLPMKLADMYGNYTDTSFRVRSINYQPDGDFLQVDVDMGSRGNAIEDLLEAIEYKLGQTTQALQTQ